MRRRAKSNKPPTASANSGFAPWLFRVGAAVFLLSIAVGFTSSLVRDRALPQVGVEYTTRLDGLLKHSEYGDAKRYLRTAARIDFDNEKMVEALLERSRQAGDIDGELEALESLVRLRPADAKTRNEFVSALLSEGRIYQAYSHARVATQLDPTSPDAFSNLGAIHLGMDQKPEAAAAYRRALELNPASEAARLALEFPLQGY